mgnify:CR=1 FL=1|jgi:hypothetical protein
MIDLQLKGSTPKAKSSRSLQACEIAEVCRRVKELRENKPLHWKSHSRSHAHDISPRHET